MLGFTQQFQKEGLICIWLGPVYSITLLFKPEYAEVSLTLQQLLWFQFFLLRTDNIVFYKLNKPSLSNTPPHLY